MTINADDLGLLGDLGTALGFLDPVTGDPVTDWLGEPGAYASRILADDNQREALLSFVDDAIGGGERTTDDRGVVWLPVVSVPSGDLDQLGSLDVFVTVEELADRVAIGVAASFTTDDPASVTSVSVPLFQASTADSPPADFSILRIGTPGARLRASTDITITDDPPIPGEAHLGAVAIEVDLPTSGADQPASFGLTLRDLQLPGSSTVADFRVALDDLDAIEEAVLEMVLALLRDQAAGAAAGVGEAVVAVAGLLGLLDDGVDALPIDDLLDRGVAAIGDWLAGLLGGGPTADPANRHAWLDHLADLLGGTRVGDTVSFAIGDATVVVGLVVGTGPSGHVELTPTVAVTIGDADARVEAVASLCRVDLTTGDATALPSFGAWGAVGDLGTDAPPVLDVTTPTVARAEVLRVGFELDEARRLQVVVAADDVLVGTTPYPTLDLTSADAVMDAAGDAIDDLADQLLSGLGDSLATIRILIGLDPPPGHPTVPTISLTDLLTDPLGSILVYWQDLVGDHGDAVLAVLQQIRDALADEAVIGGNVTGTGTPADPWRLPLVGPVTLDVSCVDDVLTVALAATTRVDTLGERCTVLETTVAATVAVIDLGQPAITLLPGAEARLLARERGVDPSRITLPLAFDAEVSADHVGLIVGWTVDGGLAAEVVAPGLTLEVEGEAIPITLPTIGADGSVDLDAAGWAALQDLIVAAEDVLGGFLGDLLDLLGWRSGRLPTLGLPDLVSDPVAAILAWLPELLMERGGTAVMGLLADLLAGAGDIGGVPLGTGHPDDPYRIDVGPGLPMPALWFPPDGIEPRPTAATEPVRSWRPGDPGLEPDELQAALEAEASIDADMADLVRGRTIGLGLSSLIDRWEGSDGRIAPPVVAPDGIDLLTIPVSAGQLVAEVVREAELDRVSTTTIHVAIGADAWPDAPADRRVDLTAPGLAPTMFSPPVAAPGDWFIALGERAACRLIDPAGLPLPNDPDGTRGQAERLAVVLAPLTTQGDDPVVVAIDGAGHACRLVLADNADVTDLFLIGTPLGPISLTALSTQPTADALRLLDTLLVPADGTAEDQDLALGRGLVRALRDLPATDPGAELRRPVDDDLVPAVDPAGPTIRVVLGQARREDIERAITAIVASGLASRARERAAAGLQPAERVEAGLHLPIDGSPGGTLRIEGQADIRLLGFAPDTGLTTSPQLRSRIWVGDRLGWLAATPELDLRMLSVDVTIALDGSAPGRAEVVLHDARVGQQRWERLVVGAGGPTVPLLPEARQLIDTAAQRLMAEAEAGANATATALVELAEAIGLFDAGGAVNDAFDQLVHDPAGLLANAYRTARAEVADAIGDLLGPLADSIDLETGTIELAAGDATLGQFGWQADIELSLTELGQPGSVDGTITIGPDAPTGPDGGFQLVIDLAPLDVDLVWHRSSTTEVVPLWPDPDAAVIARTMALALPGVAAQYGLGLVRQVDEAVRPIVDAILDAVGLLTGTVDDVERRVRSLHGLLADPAGWFRHPLAIGSQPVRAQAVLDAARPLLGLGGGAGEPLSFGAGVTLAVAGDGAGFRFDVTADSSAFTSPAVPGSRLRAALTVGLVVDPTGPASVDLAASVGVADAALPAGRQAVHLTLDRSGAVSVFLRPSTGADLTLVPFGGFATLAGVAGEVAEAALPFLLDELAELGSPVGPAVATIGDALGLRTGSPDPSFDGQRLVDWATDPVASLVAAVSSIVATGLPTLANAIDPLLPAGVVVSGDAATGELTVSFAVPVGVAVRWNPSAGCLLVEATDLTLVSDIGLDLDLALCVSAAGLEHLCLRAGPAAIDVGGVVLRPFAIVAAGIAPPGGAGAEIGLAIAPESDSERFGARWLFGGSFDLVAGPTSTDPCQLDNDTDLEIVVARALAVLLDLAASMALPTDAVQDLLDLSAGSGQVRDVLAGVILDGSGQNLLPGLFDPDTLLDRAMQLVANVAEDVAPSIDIDGSGFTVGLASDGGVIGIEVGLVQRIELVSGETMLWLETDDSWIDDNPDGDGGLFLGLLGGTVAGGDLAITPTLVVNGLGLRLGSLSGPLLDLGLTIESLAMHTYAEIDGSGLVGGGFQVQFTNLAVDAGGASGGNPIAQGILADTGSQPPKPAFSPSLAVQKRRDTEAAISMRAGPDAGPWWIGIQEGFGPLYIEQIGFGVAPPEGNIEQISIFFDGSVSMFGLQCAVDDLEITYLVRTGDQVNDLFDPASWQIDLAGLAISADLAGITIAGGLLKSGDGNNVEYLGMLMARFGVYGITIYGGYGESEVVVDGVATGERFVSFFAVGSIVGPIGGPPAFFLTGIGGGFGINRALVIPSDLSEFGDYPLIKALDTAAEPGNPMEELRALGEHFPAQPDTFWFAAGISFTSFALVNGIAVVAVEIGDGLDINLLAEAQLALPRPEVALVSIELALLARFSSSEGVLWIQGQLTDNSYLLYRDVKLTGGFAFVLWFAGPNRGQFVVTMGGYHPDFSRPDYPVVPRLGLDWKVSNNIHIWAGGYFALTSEAVMAGGDFQASAEFGPAWAEVGFGAHAIVYFDPFHYQASAYARIAAGVTVDLWILGEVTISISIGASIEVEGPDFRGSATFEVGPVELTVGFGSSGDHVDPPLSDTAFVAKYLDVGASGDGIALAAVTSFGVAPPVTGEPTPDGKPDRPYIVTPEFGLIVTTVVPATRIEAEGDGAPAPTDHPASMALGVAPMDETTIEPVLRLSWIRSGAVQAFPFEITPRPFGAFPLGVWGPAKEADNKPMPKGEVVEALNELDLAARAEVSPDANTPEIAYHRVEIGDRLPLPFTRTAQDATAIVDAGLNISALVPDPVDTAQAYTMAAEFLADTASPTAMAALEGERQSPPLIGTLGETLDGQAAGVAPAVREPVPDRTVDRSVHPAEAIAILPASGPNELGDPSRAGARRRTTVTLDKGARPWRRPPPSIASIEAERSRSIATGLVLVEPAATIVGGRGPSGPLARGEDPAASDDADRPNRPATVVATGDVPPTGSGRARPALVKRRGGEAATTLRSFSAALRAGRRVEPGRPGAEVGPGDVVVLQLPNARRDNDRSARRPRLRFTGDGGPIRVIAIDNAGGVSHDGLAGPTWVVPRGTERIVLVGQGRPDRDRPVSATGLLGWHAGLQLSYLGRSRAVGPGCVVRTRGATIGRHGQRAGAGWMLGSELAAGNTTVRTRFDRPVRSVMLIIDDPAGNGRPIEDRELLLGLSGATRAVDDDGQPRPPVVLTSENRSFVSYDVVPTGDDPVAVTAVSERGWSLVGVLAGPDLDAKEAVALVAARGLDTATVPMATGGRGQTRVRWLAPRIGTPDAPDGPDAPDAPDAPDDAGSNEEN